MIWISLWQSYIEYNVAQLILYYCFFSFFFFKSAATSWNNIVDSLFTNSSYTEPSPIGKIGRCNHVSLFTAGQRKRSVAHHCNIPTETPRYCTIISESRFNFPCTGLKKISWAKKILPYYRKLCILDVCYKRIFLTQNILFFSVHEARVKDYAWVITKSTS